MVAGGVGGRSGDEHPHPVADIIGLLVEIVTGTVDTVLGIHNEIRRRREHKPDVTVRYNAETKTAILDPTNPLLPNTEYTAVVEGTGDGDMKAVKDRGTPMARDFIFYFTTGSGCQFIC